MPLLAIPTGFDMVLFIWKESACQWAMWWCVVEISFDSGLCMECDVIGLFMIFERKSLIDVTVQQGD